ncbi:MAG: transposase [Deltaproteobacteria bacterium]|nr:transposase [Deltaproteobacteria bacterium]
MGYSGHKHQKGEKELTIAENQGFVLGPIAVKPVNAHDSTLLPEAFSHLLEFTRRIGVDLQGARLTLDSGFDSQTNKALIREQGLVPVICPNRRNTQEPIAIARLYRWFDRDSYRQRYKVERTFAWQDTYRKLVVSYERLKETRLGFRYLAYALINFRVTFDHS